MSLLLLQPNRVVAAAPSGDPPAFAPNLPPDFVVTSELNFDAVYANGTGPLVNGWQFSGTAGQIPVGGVLRDAYERVLDSSGGNGPYIGRMFFRDFTPNGNGWTPENQLVTATGSGAVSLIQNFPQNSVREVYTSVTVRFSPNYVVQSNAFTEKFWYPLMTNIAANSAAVQLGYTGANVGQPPFRLGTLHVLENGNASFVVSSAEIFPALWYNIEIRQRIGSFNAERLPTRANDDGFTRIWVNGQLVQDFQAWRASWFTAQSFFSMPRFTSTRGGAPSAVPVPFGGMYRDYDRVLVAHRVEA